jgi:hypothetical protein
MASGAGPAGFSEQAASAAIDASASAVNRTFCIGTFLPERNEQ